MQILIIGGSNSLLRGGYVQQLEQSLQGHSPVHIKQISVGATTTLSAIGRLHETYQQQPVDVIVYEYAINDAGHFAPREDGAASWQLCLYLLLKTAAKLYPSAIFVPLVLAQQRHFPRQAAHPFYQAQIDSYRALGLPYLDIRAWMGQLFLDRAPDWMYQDEAHYSSGAATAIIGALLARHLLELVAQRAQPLSSVFERARASSPYAQLEMVYLPAVNLRQFCSGSVEPAHLANRLMQLDFLRMHPGSTLSLHSAMYPLALFLKSDRQHDALDLGLQTDSGQHMQLRVATRHLDTASYNFIYSSIPVPLLWSQSLLTRYSATTLTLGVPADAGGAQVGFDCFAPGLPEAGQRYLDLVGILLVTQN